MMKKVLLIALSLALVSPVAAQKNLLADDIGVLLLKTQRNKTLSANFKALARAALQVEEDDCTPPPCTGIIDPWTCECYPDIRDPWENKVLASKMKAAQKFEASIAKGSGNSFLSQEEYLNAKKRHPGSSLKAIVNRLNYYAALKK